MSSKVEDLSKKIANGPPSTPNKLLNSRNAATSNTNEKGGGEDGNPNRPNSRKKSPYRKHNSTGRGGRHSGRGRGRGGRGDGAKTNRNSSNKSPNKNSNHSNKKRSSKSPTRYRRHQNKSSSNNRNSKVREIRQLELNSSSLTDEDVLIAFGPLLKSENVHAIRIHEQFKLDSNHALFMANARRLITTLSTSNNHEFDRRVENSESVTSSNNKHASPLSHHDDPIVNMPDRNEIDLQLQSKDKTHSTKPSQNRNNLQPSNPLIAQQNLTQPHSQPKSFKNIHSNAPSQNTIYVREQMRQMTIQQAPSLKNSNAPPIKNTHGIPNAPPPGLTTPPNLSTSTNPSTTESSNNDFDKSKELNDDTAPKINETAQPVQQVSKPKIYTPKRLFRNQPGTLYANDHPPHTTVSLKPRSQLRARWSIPITFLRDRTIEQSKKMALAAANNNSANAQPPINPNITIRDALETLCVGLFRLGCPENGQHFTIVSKKVLESGSFRIQEHPQTPQIWGEVPFYAPRSPGKVIFRLFFSDDTVPTIATGPLIHVDVKTGADVDSTLRFLLSNFKSKKGAQISTMHSVATVFASFSPPPSSSPPRHHNHHSNHYNNHNNNPYDGAGRAAWGCVCESRKALDFAGLEFAKKKTKLNRAEEELLLWKEEHAQKEEEEKKNEAGPTDESKKQLECNLGPEDNDEEIEAPSVENVNDNSEKIAGNIETKQDETEKSNEGESHDQESVPEKEMTLDLWKEKMGSLRGEKASNERKWRDAQVAYASILREALSNNSSSLLLRRDLLTKLRLEFELWCPICEAFAPNPFEKNKPPPKPNDDSSQQPVFNIYPHPIAAQHFKLCAQARNELRMEALEFLPRTETLQQLLSYKGSSVGNTVVGQQGKFTATGNTVLQRLSNVMQKLYTDQLCPSKEFYETRSLVRSKIELIVNESNAFPLGTKVVLFGSVANGFGSPNSDLDMCIELPPGTVFDSSDANGSSAMAILAQAFTDGGMVEVNTSRLSARIPIIMFEYPFKVDEDNTLMLQCDISMQNPLACLNTQLLKAYSSLDPRVCVLASIIKRWAKRRNINNPSHHTLSSYGYTIMLLHFLTRPSTLLSTHQSPVLPNLQWIDHVALSQNRYSLLPAKPNHPQFLVRHPTEPDFLVNSYFFRPNDARLHQTFSQNKQSVGYLLTAFFRYYAFEFDFKKHIVSLNNTSRGLIEKEIKAETDGWRLGAVANVLAIEDPFETFYDVAHVLKQSSFQRVKREFVRAYSKIVEAVWNGQANGLNKGEALLDWICEDVAQQITETK